MTKFKSEVLAPAGSMEALIAAVRCGADAVYLGMQQFSARKNAANFSYSELKTAVEYCHARGVKVYVTLNTLIRDDEMKDAMDAVKTCCDCKVDALIIQDLGLAAMVRRAAPDMEMHASTQMSVQTLEGIEILRDLGFTRAVVPRELSKQEIKYLADNSPIELELFVHGALCMCLSGQCLLSAVLGSRSGNRGLCAQPCRLPFASEHGTGNDLSLKDMSIIENLCELEDMGIASFKIEGRMKRPEYVAAATTACRKSLDGLDSREYEQKLGAIFSRSGFTSGYYDSKLGRDMFGIRRKEDVISAKDVLAPLAELYNGEQPLTEVQMTYTAHAGKPASLIVSARNQSVFATADEAVEKAQNRAVTADEIEARLKKCGSTQFYAKKVDVKIDDDLYISAKEINSLRRKALEELESKIAHTPQIAFKMPNLYFKRRVSKNKGFVVRVKSVSQIPRDLRNVRRMILPLDTPANIVAKLKSLKIQPAVEVGPAIFGSSKRIYESLIKAKENGFQLAAVSNLDGIAIAKKAGLSICTITGTNIFNSYSLEEYRKLGVSDAILSPELKLTQAEIMGSTLPRGIFAYGRLPLMQVRNCPVKNGKTCAECKQTGKITDRKGISFPIECNYIASTILNSVPVVLSDKQSQFDFADFSLIWFTKESREQCLKVLDNYRNNAIPEGDFTRGLAFRGVE